MRDNKTWFVVIFVCAITISILIFILNILNGSYENSATIGKGEIFEKMKNIDRATLERAISKFK
jgi:hypothetical protein